MLVFRSALKTMGQGHLALLFSQCLAILSHGLQRAMSCIEIYGLLSYLCGLAYHRTRSLSLIIFVNVLPLYLIGLQRVMPWIGGVG